MKILVVSDLHIDVNKAKAVDYGFKGNINKVDVVLIAGDISGGYKQEQEFLDDIKKISDKPVICVGGNHLGYNYSLWQGVQGTKEWSIKYLKTRYNCNDDKKVCYLENDYVDIGDFIVFGGTMYSNFELYGKENVHKYGYFAEISLNDFNYVHVCDFNETENMNIRRVKYTDYVRWFEGFMASLKKCLREHNKKDFIVLSHFAPSIQSIGGQYVGSQLNPVYASDLENFIKEYSQIKLWAHGHIHSPSDYMIGNCRVVCEPYGYYGYEQEMSTDKYIGKVIEV